MPHVTVAPLALLEAFSLDYLLTPAPSVPVAPAVLAALWTLLQALLGMAVEPPAVVLQKRALLCRWAQGQVQGHWLGVAPLASVSSMAQSA